MSYAPLGSIVLEPPFPVIPAKAGIQLAFTAGAPYLDRHLSGKVNRLAIHRVGIGTDLHRLAAGRRLILGHVPIEHSQGPVAHSDGDVVIHAVIDALAGAAGLPDIGEMFPDDDPAYAGVDSSRLIEETLKAVTERGYAIVNVDLTIHAQQPKLSRYKPAIRVELARLLGMATDAVSIKAKSGEGVDAVGRGEAIACTAVVALAAMEAVR